MKIQWLGNLLSPTGVAQGDDGLGGEHEPSHPFGGCNKSLNHYRTIGQTLLKIESGGLYYGYSSQRTVQEFREAVAVVPVELLEAYLEDLLDRRVNQDILFIARPGIWNSLDILTIASLLGSVVVGMYLSLQSHSALVGGFATLSLALPVITVWFRSPVGNLARRLTFARILSREIARRRGSDKDGEKPSFSIRRLLGGEQEQSLDPTPASSRSRFSRNTYH